MLIIEKRRSCAFKKFKKYLQEPLEVFIIEVMLDRKNNHLIYIKNLLNEKYVLLSRK